MSWWLEGGSECTGDIRIAQIQWQASFTNQGAAHPGETISQEIRWGEIKEDTGYFPLPLTCAHIHTHPSTHFNNEVDLELVKTSLLLPNNCLSSLLHFKVSVKGLSSSNFFV